MDFDMQHVKIEATRYAVTLEGRQIGYCIIMNDLWSFFCNIDNTVTKGPTPEMAIARKIARLKMSRSPAGAGNK